MPQWKQFSGQWTVTQAAQAKGAGTWPSPPGAPTIGTATGGNAQASVAFTAPANPGYPTTLTYEVTSSPGSITATGSASPIVVTGLTNGTEYTFTVTATNDTGTGPASAASNAVTPAKAGAMYSWGSNNNGALGQNIAYTVNVSSPVQIGSESTWTNVAGSLTGFFFLASKSDGTLWAWGKNDKGQLGVNDRVYRSSPTQIGALTTWTTAISAGRDFTLAIKTNGTLWAWGNNQNGNFGNGAWGYQRSSPIQVGSSTNWASVSGYKFHSLFMRTDGTLYSAGYNTVGQLGTNNVLRYSSPVQIGSDSWVSLLTQQGGGYVSLGVTSSGALYSWGSGSLGGLGQNSININKSSPTQIGALTTWTSATNRAIGGYAFKNDGSLWGWGNNFNTLGLVNSYIRYSSPVQILSAETWTGGMVRTQDDNSTHAIDSSGQRWVWGSNFVGFYGDNTTGTYNSPKQIGAENTWLFVAASSYGSPTALGIKSE